MMLFYHMLLRKQISPPTEYVQVIPITSQENVQSNLPDCRDAGPYNHGKKVKKMHWFYRLLKLFNLNNN